MTMKYIFYVFLVVCAFYAVHTWIEIYKHMKEEIRQQDLFVQFCEDLAVGDVFEETGMIVYSDPFLQRDNQTLTVLEIKSNNDGELWVNVEVSCEGTNWRKSMQVSNLYKFYKKVTKE